MKPSPLLESSYAFSLEIVNLCRHIADKQKEFVLTRQLLRSATSVGANIQEANDAQSRKDFISKMNIALKEAGESLYWLRLMRDSKLIQSEIAENRLKQCSEIKYMLIASLKTARTRSAS